MLDRDKTREQLIEEIEGLRQRVLDLETFILSSSEESPSRPSAHHEPRDIPGSGKESAAFDATQTLYLDQLLTRDITDSGSFDIRGDIWATTFGKVLQSLPIPVSLIDLSGKIMVFNQAWLRMAPACDDLTDKPFMDLFPEGGMKKMVRETLDEVIENRAPKLVETGLVIGGKAIWARITFRSIRIVDTRAVLALFEDLTNERKQYLAAEKRKAAANEANATLKHEVNRRKRVEEMLRKSLDEKEILLREIHHRVNNNLQIMSSLLRLQASKTDEVERKAIVKEVGDRIQSMALVFEKLYRSKHVAKLNSRGYISGLVNYLAQSYEPIGRRVKLVTDVEDLEIDVEVGGAMGLILCELLSNALRHAFPGERTGTVSVTLRSISGNRMELMVKDDGVGLPEGIEEGSGSLGLSLIEALSRQMGGSVEVRRDNGALFRLELNMEAQRPRTVEGPI
jgi:PAS domain S-box-containing protein